MFQSKRAILLNPKLAIRAYLGGPKQAKSCPSIKRLIQNLLKTLSVVSP